MMSKIQILNGTHNYNKRLVSLIVVVYDVKDTNFEWTKITPTAVLADLAIRVLRQQIVPSVRTAYQ